MSFLATPGSATKPQATQTAIVSGVPIQTSVVGQATAIVFGTTRIGGNLIWYGGFKKKKHTQANAAQSGKGGGMAGGASGKGQQADGTVSYTYSASFAFGLCEGPIDDVLDVYSDKSVRSLSQLGMGLVAGHHGQGTWNYLDLNFPDKALAYSGLAYVTAQNFDLTTTPQVPTLSYEVKGFGPFHSGDVVPATVISGLLTNAKYGIDFPSARLGALTDYTTYTKAANLYVSAAYQDQRSAADIVQEMVSLTNAECVWTGGVLEIVPHGDETLTANGETYIPPQAPLFDLDDDDFLSTDDNGPVLVTRTRPSDACNAVMVEFLNRNRRYSPDTAEAKDQARIDTYGLITAPTVSGHIFCLPGYARKSAQLQLQRLVVRNQYRFRLDQRYMLLDPMDIVSVTDEVLGLDRQWVRILEITETDGGFDILAEEYLNGTGTAAEYDLSESDGFAADYNAAPDPANEPLFIEPTAELAGALEVLVAVSASGENWGGADVWISLNGTDYSIAGRIKDGARMGELTSPLPSIAEAFADTTLDNFNTLSIDISESGEDAALVSVSSEDAQALSTTCYVDGEYLAYATATLTGTGTYDLTSLIRGAYGTSPDSHAVGTRFCRIDSSLLAIPYTQAQIGTTFKVKITSLNVYGGGQESLSDVPEYQYTITGSALQSPLSDVTDFRAVYVDNVIYLDWSEVSDFRAVQYEIRKGPSWEAGQSLGRFAHPTAATQGEGVYWVAAVTVQNGNAVYSETPTSLDLSATPTVVALLNTVTTWDEAATLFGGTVSGDVMLQGGGASVSTTAAGDIVADTDVTDDADVTNYGGQGSGIYEIPVSHEVDLGYVTAAKVTVNWTSGGANIADNILTLADYLNSPDVLSSGNSQLVEVYPEIAISQVVSPMVLCLQFNGTQGSTTITDEKGHAFTAFGNAKLDASTKKFGSASLVCDGTGDYVSTPDAAAYDLGSSDFTVETWFYADPAGNGTRRWICGQTDGSAAQTSFIIELYSGNYILTWAAQGAVFTNIIGTTTITTAGWHHVAYVRTGNVLKMFLDGVQEGGNVAFTGACNTSNTEVSVGRGGSFAAQEFYGYIDSFAMQIGVAKYTANFTPPTSEVTDDQSWGPWTRFSGAGTYQGRRFKSRMQITTLQSDIIASLLSFSFAVAVPLRIDHFNNQALSSGGSTISFRPDGGSNALFNKGPGGVSTPHVQASVRGGAAGDSVVISAVSLTSVTLKVVSIAGADKAGNVDIQVVGY